MPYSMLESWEDRKEGLDTIPGLKDLLEKRGLPC